MCILLCLPNTVLTAQKTRICRKFKELSKTLLRNKVIWTAGRLQLDEVPAAPVVPMAILAIRSVETAVPVHHSTRRHVAKRIQNPIAPQVVVQVSSCCKALPQEGHLLVIQTNLFISGFPMPSSEIRNMETLHQFTQLDALLTCISDEVTHVTSATRMAVLGDFQQQSICRRCLAKVRGWRGRRYSSSSWWWWWWGWWWWNWRWWWCGTGGGGTGGGGDVTGGGGGGGGDTGALANA